MLSAEPLSGDLEYGQVTIAIAFTYRSDKIENVAPGNSSLPLES
jgi:hypothetical protein